MRFSGLSPRSPLRGLLQFVSDLRTYSRLEGAEPVLLRYVMPQLADRTPTSAFDHHYFYQDVWAAKHIAAMAPREHVDVGSRVDFVGFLTALTQVTFVDIRPLEASVENLRTISASATALPFADRSIESLSCLHVAEHIGLGRYGDPLDPAGTRKAAAELARVLRPQGQLLFALPVGRPRLCFNAHRIHDPRAVVEMFASLRLMEFSAVDDSGSFRRFCIPDEFSAATYACGLFRFQRDTLPAGAV